MEFVVHVPSGTPHWEPLYISGSSPTFGDWSATGVPLQRHDDGTARAVVQFPAGAQLQYLITRGDWRQAENDGHGHERPPREFVARKDVRVDVHVAGWGRDSVRYHTAMESAFLTETRPVTVYLPPGYDLESFRRYPVLYMHDGQNLFDASTSFGGVAWRCDDVAERMARSHQAQPVIIVGVGNTRERMREYGPTAIAEDLAEAYGRFLTEELKPFIDKTYRTSLGPMATGVGGSSMGGLVSLYLIQKYPQVFGRCAAMSPSLWWDRESWLRNIATDGSWLAQTRIWLDMGDQEGMSRTGQQGNLRRTRKLAKALKYHHRIPGQDYQYLEIPGGQHTESAWHARFDAVLKFLFPAHTNFAE
ncbi:MAG: alpha/beta hydrolase-fold protein [Fimbriiglobus sp.]